MSLIRLKSGTRAQVDSAAAASALNAREPYLLTDENRLAVGLGVDTFRACLMEGDAVGSGGSIQVTLADGTELLLPEGDGGVIDVTLADGTETTLPQGTVSSVDLSAKLDAQGGTLDGYQETSATLSIVTGEATIPLDGRIYALTVDQSVALLSSSAPTPPICGSAVVFIQQAAIAESVSAPATWYWADGTAETFAENSSLYRLLLTTDPFGNIHADAELRGQPT